VHQPHHRLTLILAGRLVDDREQRTVPFVYRTWPAHDHGRADAVQPDVAVMALVDLVPDHGTTSAVSW